MFLKFLIVFLNILNLIKSVSSIVDINVDRNSRHLIDNAGRVRIFHGVNIVVKNPPFTPLEDNFDPLFSLSEKDYDYLVEFGFNVVRLGVIWEAVETAPGFYNHTYLDIYENIIKKLGERGIYTILDSHQDMFSRLLCGEGVPVFYAQDLVYKTECNSTYLESVLNYLGVCLKMGTKNIPRDENGLPKTDECKKHSFTEFHQVIELTSIYASFYDNLNNIQDKFIAYWKVLARRFKGNRYIIGYDIWNELWVGDLFSYIENLMPGHSTNKHFLSFYSKVDKELRKEDEEYVLMFEEALFPDTLPFLGGFYLGGYEKTPAENKYLHKQIWSNHYYCKGYSGEMSRMKTIPAEISKNECKVFAEYKMRTATAHAEKLGVNLFITEFGACEEGDDNGESCYHEIKGLADAADRYHLSWAYWAYKPYGDHTTHCSDDTEGIWYGNGSIQNMKLKALTRPYFMAFQGTPIKSFFLTELNLLHSKFVFNPDIIDSSIVYVNKRIHFPNGFKFIFISHQINDHLITDSKVTVHKSNQIIDGNDEAWLDSDCSLGDYQYLKFQINPKHRNHADEESIKNSILGFHQYLGFSTVLENTVEFLLAPRLNYRNIYQNEELFKANRIKAIEFNYEDLNVANKILNRELADNVILIENVISKNIKEKRQSATHYALLDFKNLELEDLDHFEISQELVKPIELNKEVLLDLVYINKMSIKLIFDETVIWEANVENILNHFIKIRVINY